MEGYYYKPRVDWEVLNDHAELAGFAHELRQQLAEIRLFRCPEPTDGDGREEPLQAPDVIEVPMGHDEQIDPPHPMPAEGIGQNDRVAAAVDQDLSERMDLVRVISSYTARPNSRYSTSS